MAVNHEKGKPMAIPTLNPKATPYIPIAGLSSKPPTDTSVYFSASPSVSEPEGQDVSEPKDQGVPLNAEESSEEEPLNEAELLESTAKVLSSLLDENLELVLRTVSRE